MQRKIRPRRPHDGVPHGAKGTYRKVTVTLPPDAYECLVQECARRKIAGKPNHLFSAIVRQALMQYLAGEWERPKERRLTVNGRIASHA